MAEGRGRLITASDGRHLDDPGHLAASTGRLTAAQQALARKKRGSNRRRKAVARLAAPHAKARRRRLDGAHNLRAGLALREAAEAA